MLSCFNFRLSSIESRSPFLVFFPPRVGTHLSRSFLFLISRVWNKLPLALQSEKNSGKFKNNIRRHFIDYKYLVSGIPPFLSFEFLRIMTVLLFFPFPFSSFIQNSLDRHTLLPLENCEIYNNNKNNNNFV